jgi:predicted Rossmann fold nucleotide-binding protein DprA/Smf involved in DNA uptake
VRVGPQLGKELTDLLDLVDRGAVTPDALARASGLEPGPIATALLRLELSGYLLRNGEGRFQRTALAPPDPA